MGEDRRGMGERSGQRGRGRRGKERRGEERRVRGEGSGQREEETPVKEKKTASRIHANIIHASSRRLALCSLLEDGLKPRTLNTISILLRKENRVESERESGNKWRREQGQISRKIKD